MIRLCVFLMGGNMPGKTALALVKRWYRKRKQKIGAPEELVKFHNRNSEICTINQPVYSAFLLKNKQKYDIFFKEGLL